MRTARARVLLVVKQKRDASSVRSNAVSPPRCIRRLDKLVSYGCNRIVNFGGIAVTTVSRCRCGYITLQGLRGKKKRRFFSVALKQNKREVGAHRPLRSVGFCRSGRRATVVTNAASGDEELEGIVWENADDPASFKSDIWKHFGF